MKNCILGIFFLIAASFTVSCVEDDPGSSSGKNYMLSDTRLVGNWIVDRYDAYNSEKQLVNSTTDLTFIKTGYWRIDMTADCSMFLWYGDYSQAAVITDFYYDDVMKVLYFGETGEAEVTTLNDSVLVFNSINLMPAEWFEKAYTGEYHYVTSTLKKEKQSSQ